jgi:hypothetical protein
VVLWLAGTAGATGVVFYAVSQMSTDLASVNAKNNESPSLRQSDSTSAAKNVVTTTTTSPDTTSLITLPGPEPTTVAAVTAVTPETQADPQETEAPPAPTTQPRTGTTAPRQPNPGTTVATQAPTVPTPAPTPPPTTPAPPPPTTAPPPPPPTTVGISCVNDVRPVQRIGTVFVRACNDGIHFVTARVVNGTWTPTPLTFGPPSVTVRFSSTGGTVYTCSISGDLDGVFTSGDC